MFVGVLGASPSCHITPTTTETTTTTSGAIFAALMARARTLRICTNKNVLHMYIGGHGDFIAALMADREHGAWRAHQVFFFTILARTMSWRSTWLTLRTARRRPPMLVGRV